MTVTCEYSKCTLGSFTHDGKLLLAPFQDGDGENKKKHLKIQSMSSSLLYVYFAVLKPYQGLLML